MHEPEKYDDKIADLLGRLEQIEKNQLTILKWIKALSDQDFILADAIITQSAIVSNSAWRLSRQMTTQLEDMINNYQGQIEASNSHG